VLGRTVASGLLCLLLPVWSLLSVNELGLRPQPAGPENTGVEEAPGLSATWS
jgi:hypothetical protein